MSINFAKRWIMRERTWGMGGSVCPRFRVLLSISLLCSYVSLVEPLSHQWKPRLHTTACGRSPGDVLSLFSFTASMLLFADSVESARFNPKWTSSSTQPEVKQGAAVPHRKHEARTKDLDRDVSDEATCAAGQCQEHSAKREASSEGAGVAIPNDAPLPPVYTTKLSIPRRETSVDQSSLVDPSKCTLHVASDASFRHGVTIGMTVTARNSAGEPISAPGLPFVYNVTGVGDSNTGTVFDLQNGTIFVYSTVYYSPAIDKSKGAEVWVRLHGRHIQGSPRRIPIDMARISEDYNRRVEEAKAVGSEPSLGGSEGCGGEFVIVTGASQHMFDRAVNLVGSIHHWAPRTPVVFFDLGLSSVQAEDVRTWENVDYRKFDFTGYPEHVGSLGEKGAYAWRSPILVNASNEFQCTLWLDAGLELRGDISVIKGHIAVDGHFFVTNGWPSPNRFTHPAVLDWHGLKESDLFTQDQGSVRNEIEACGGIQGYRRGSDMHQIILQGYHRCSMETTCMTPPGASKMNFRQDQTVLNVVLAVYRQQVALDSEEYFRSLAHTARKYWEHPIPKHEFPVGDDGTFKPCDKGQVFRDGKCLPCDDPDGLCDDDVLDELEGAVYAEDLVIFIRRAFEPKLYEEALRYRLTGSV